MANQPAKMIGLAHIGIFTKDIEASKAFYQKLGFSVDDECQPGARLAFLSLGSCLLELIQPADVSTVDAKSVDGVVAHVAIECTYIDEIVSGFKAQGLIPQDAQVSTADNILDGVKNIFFAGPSGEQIELFDYYKRY